MNARVSLSMYQLPAAGALAALLFAGTAFAQVSPRMERRYPLDGKPVVTVRNPVGHIQVKAWDKHEVAVSAQYSIRVGIVTEQVGNRIEITSVPLPGVSEGDDIKTDYIISVPTESELRVHTDSGIVTVDSVHGDMSFDTVAADLSLQDVQGFLMIRSIGGSLVCTRCSGRIDATSISGNFQMLQPSMDNVRLQTSSGNILFDGSFQSSGIYVLRNYSGTIEVRFSTKDSIDVRAASLYGSVINQAPVAPDRRVRTSSQAPAVANSFFGSLNQGQAKVELSSFDGTIKILKRD